MPKAPEPASTERPVPGEVRETLRWVTKRFRKLYGSRLKVVILFGAREKDTPESDVALLAVLDGPIGSYAEGKQTSRGGNPCGPLPRPGPFFHLHKRRGVRRGSQTGRYVCSRGGQSPVESRPRQHVFWMLPRRAKGEPRTYGKQVEPVSDESDE